jgi:hypothetical protein
MKSRRGAILIAGPGDWRIGAPTGSGVIWTETGISAAAGIAEIAEKLPAALDRAGCRGRPVVLALPSGDCLAASIATAALPRKDRRRAMEYRREGKLPLAIEEVSADFVSHNGRTLGVCVRTDKISAIIQAVRRSGAQVAAVCPAAILGFQSNSPATKGDTEVDAIIWRNGDSADVFLLEADELIQWHWVPATAADVHLILASHFTTARRSTRLALRGATREWHGQIARLPDVQIIADDPVAQDDAAAETTGRVLNEEIEPLVNFLPQGGGVMPLRRPLVAAAAACLLLCLCLIGGTFCRAQRYADLAAGFDDRQRQLYQQLFPGEAIPLGIESRLRSYAGAIQRPESSGPSSLTLLYNVLAHLPAGGKFQFDELEFDSGQATLHGAAGSLAEADQIAASLRYAPNLSVDDPQTQQLAGGGVGFTISVRQRGAR